ncbi:16S rRNA (adenine(1518)-N(6)/adenine(1519)-N(6))-dimethyltransferase RsmA [Collinsella sp. zg1085]|uniref:16S rRNA (adenine(1518)-N(6)/adenine(1519)-N(6))- dimethyltransferase RsmA n=1 Tax=Collinsella sp. zg1085 TaxID=2844380 RepID=UPI001C0C365A|nr:16S rRNA (adenine(1518)-N(6)/adenine(1519)-N(6))-dimethyltransferase RsmA [Collinsella sp. zg1085]QWT17453.1 16S rRNA (adenine(1518)-N(6)/adenine(1519)-N(6))-dimethyltransferase RsmA [Collinsella sp. zg1085]
MTTSLLASPTATRALLDAYGLTTKYRFGQNFLVDNHVIEKIMALSELTGTERVLEVGPGIGTLSLALLQEAAQLISLEMDTDLEPVLANHAAANPHFTYMLGDALQISAEEIVAHAGGEPELFVANLPYNVAATLILDYIAKFPTLKRCVVMVQKEVADRIAAHPGTKAYGAYTAKLGLYVQVTGRFEVPPRCFMPAPHVDSAVIRLDRRTTYDGFEIPAELELAALERVIDACFVQRRKTVRNSMTAAGFDKTLLDAAFEQSGIAATSRGETLALPDFIRLATALVALGVVHKGKRCD